MKPLQESINELQDGFFIKRSFPLWVRELICFDFVYIILNIFIIQKYSNTRVPLFYGRKRMRTVSFWGDTRKLMCSWLPIIAQQVIGILRPKQCRLFSQRYCQLLGQERMLFCAAMVALARTGAQGKVQAI